MIATAEIQADTERVEAFGNRLTEILHNGALALGLSIGHRTGLFDTLDTLPPATSERIAEQAGLNQRYVREWLGAMVTGGLVEYEPTDSTYRLPPEHAALLTRRNSPNNLAVPAQFLPVIASVEDRIVDCFRNGGGVGYDHFDRFHEVMAEESCQTVVAALFDHILPLASELPGRLCDGIDVADIGCGMGRALIALASEYPNSRFTGFDLASEAIDDATERAHTLGLRNVRFEALDLSTFDRPGAFDLVTAFDVVHDQAEPDRVLRNVHAALRPDGVFLMQDIRTSSHLENNVDHPLGPFLYTISYNHCMTVSLARDGAGLGTCWGRELAEQMLREARFADVAVYQLEHDVMNDFFVARACHGGKHESRLTTRRP
jgi:2-polyprenyl-3-methyl-5-hydroxy-6-metoxy-1,4-benzoquinol methylase